MQLTVYFCATILDMFALSSIATTTTINFSPTHNKLVNSINSDTDMNLAKTHLFNHLIYDAVVTIDDMRTFTESHVWAVWDFMTLLKRLQRDFTNTNKIWTPRSSAENARFIGEICLSEESDEYVNSASYTKHISHFELYLIAMEDIGANTTVIRNFVTRLDNGDNFIDALIEAPISDKVKMFVLNTIITAVQGSTIHATSAFFFGRGDPIPEMFEKFLKNVVIDSVNVYKKFANFRYYLERHIEVDESDHGPKAIALLDSITMGDDNKIKIAIDAGTEAIKFRIEFWNDIYERITGKSNNQ